MCVVRFYVECTENHVWGPPGPLDLTNFVKHVFFAKVGKIEKVGKVGKVDFHPTVRIDTIASGQPPPEVRLASLGERPHVMRDSPDTTQLAVQRPSRCSSSAC